MRSLHRLDDAVCALMTGHSRRDLDRVRQRRFRLLAERLVKRRQREAAHWAGVVSRWPGYFEPTLADRRADLQASVDLLEDVIQGRHRLVGAILLRELEIDRCLLKASRVLRRPEVGAIDGCAEHAPHHLEPLLVLADERYGKLYEGLLQYGILHAFQHKLRFGIRHLPILLGRIDLFRTVFRWADRHV